LEAELDQHVARPPRLGADGLLDIGERGRLPDLDAIERLLQSRQRAAQSAARDLAREAGRKTARLEFRAAIERGAVAGLGVCRLLDRTSRGRIGNRAQCHRALFQCRLPARDLIELALELLLIEQLPAGDAIDL